ncbi:hypothetical protein QQF64_011377 [Cirrhinus molitorella]|uniref:Uncharacterized protein n=1 Tax=Cirrhinus molitorella TaxID=172907 RepID=A0ABR3LZ33_9TELE
MRYARPNNAEELKATIRATWALITPEQCHRLIDSMPLHIAAVIQAKGVLTLITDTAPKATCNMAAVKIQEARKNIYMGGPRGPYGPPSSQSPRQIIPPGMVQLD